MTNPNAQIITRHGVRTVTEAQLADLRDRDISWPAYCQQRLVLDHAEAVEALTTRAFRLQNPNRQLQG